MLENTFWRQIEQFTRSNEIVAWRQLKPPDPEFKLHFVCCSLHKIVKISFSKNWCELDKKCGLVKINSSLLVTPSPSINRVSADSLSSTTQCGFYEIIFSNFHWGYRAQCITKNPYRHIEFNNVSPSTPSKHLWLSTNSRAYRVEFRLLGTGNGLVWETNSETQSNIFRETCTVGVIIPSKARIHSSFGEESHANSRDRFTRIDHLKQLRGESSVKVFRVLPALAAELWEITEDTVTEDTFRPKAEFFWRFFVRNRLDNVTETLQKHDFCK